MHFRCMRIASTAQQRNWPEKWIYRIACYGTHTDLADQQLHLPQRGSHSRTFVKSTGPGFHHWLPRSRHCHWALGPGAGDQCGRHPALCRIWRGADAFSGGAGAGTQAPLEPAPPHLWLGQCAGAGLHRSAFHGFLPVGLVGARRLWRLAHATGRRAGDCAVQHRDCLAGDG